MRVLCDASFYYCPVPLYYCDDGSNYKLKYNINVGNINQIIASMSVASILLL